MTEQIGKRHQSGGHEKRRFGQSCKHPGGSRSEPPEPIRRVERANRQIADAQDERCRSSSRISHPAPKKGERLSDIKERRPPGSAFGEERSGQRDKWPKGGKE